MRMYPHGALLGGLCVAAVTTVSAQRRTAARSDTALTPALIARGDSIYHGLVGGGFCSSCHGTDAKGFTGLAPDLTSGKWLGGDGSLAFIMETVANGVPQPRQAPSPMPSMAGPQLGPADIRAVAAYIYSLSHPRGKRR